MKEFVIDVFKFMFFLTVSFAVMMMLFFLIVSPQYSLGYDAAIIDKRSRLRGIEKPKIIIIGDSNVCFGIDSQMIETELEMPVVNMGLHGSVGNRIMENLSKENIGPGDIVIECASSFCGDGGIVDPVVGWLTIENHYQLWKCVDTDDYFLMFRGLPTYMRKSCMLFLNGEGNKDPGGGRLYFNQYGDIKHLSGVNRDNPIDASNMESIPALPDKEFIMRMYDMQDYCSERGASFLLTTAPIVEGSSTPSPEEYDTVQVFIEKELPCELITDFNSNRYDYKYFEDNVLHLNKEGAELRTRQLIKDIKTWRYCRE